MSFQDSKPSPSQVLANNKADLANLFKYKQKNNKLPDKIARYQIVEEIGRGGMGLVYKAYDPQMDQFVALKIILISEAEQKEVKRFTQEAKAMAKFSYPHIVKIYNIYNVGEELNNPFIVMDYIKGVSLKEYLENNPLNIRLFCQLMAKIANAIAYAHQKGIIHRDLKPANIMLDENKEPQVMDFGLAKLVKANESLSKKGTIVGTPKYMSPEQAQGQDVDHLTDVYALGAIFYEMLVNKSLINGQSVAEIIFKVIYKEPEPLRKINDKLSIDLETICTKAIEKKPSKRYQSANEFAADINRFLNGELIEARAYNFLEKNVKRLQQNKMIIAVSVVSILSLVIGIFLFKDYQDKNINQQLKKHLAQASTLQEKARGKNIDQQIHILTKAKNHLEKALELKFSNTRIEKRLLKIQEQMGNLAMEKKNYLLASALFSRCKKLDKLAANKLLKDLKLQQSKLKKQYKTYIDKAMKNLTKQATKTLMDNYVFKIVKMQKPYIVAFLIPYLKSNNKWKRFLAIKSLGKLGNRHAKFQGKDTVEWLLQILVKFREKNEKETIEIIKALGWLRDSRANDLVYDVRYLSGQNSALWAETKIAYKLIPLDKGKMVKSARQFGTRGIMKKEKGDYKGAIDDYTKAIQLNPKFPAAYNNRGLVYQHLKQYAKAITNYSKAIELNPRNSETYNNRANAYQDIKQYVKAITDYTKAINLNPRNFRAYTNRANVYRNLKQYLKAIIDYNYIVQRHPNYPNVYGNRGLTYLNLKQYSKAINDFNQAIKLNPKNFTVYNNRADAYRDSQRYQKALIDYTEAIRINPQAPEVFYNRGLTYQYLKDHTKAIIDYNYAIKLKPDFLLAYNNRGNAYAIKNMYSQAFADYERVIKLNPKFSKVYGNRGNAYQKIKQYSKALDDYNKVINLNPLDAKAYSNKGNTYQAIEQHSKAIEAYTKAIKLNPKYFEAYSNRANTYMQKKMYTQALADYTKAIRINPNFIEAYFNRANAYKATKKYAKALDDYTRSIRMNPLFPFPYVNRGTLYQTLKKHSKAYQDFQMFLKLTPNHPIAPRVYAIMKNLKKQIK